MKIHTDPFRLLVILLLGVGMITSSGCSQDKPSASSKALKNPPIVIFTIGKPYLPYFKAQKETAKQWGINLKQIFAGCAMSQENKKLEERFDKQNIRAIKIYEKRFGKDWWKRFNDEIRAKMRN